MSRSDTGPPPTKRRSIVEQWFGVGRLSLDDVEEHSLSEKMNVTEMSDVWQRVDVQQRCRR